MANKDFKVKNGIDIQSPLPVSMGGTGQTSTTNTLNSLLPAQAGNTNKVLQTDGTNVTWATIDLSTKQNVVSGVSDVEIGYLDGVTSAIQTQLDLKSNLTKTISTKTTDYTLALADKNTIIEFNSSSDLNLTLPTYSSVALSAGDNFLIINRGTGKVNLLNQSGTIPLSSFSMSPSGTKISAFYANDLYLVLINSNWYKSTDSVTWTNTGVYVSSSSSVYPRRAAYGNGLFAIGANNGVYTSIDGTTWTRRLITTSQITSIKYANGKFIASDADATPNIYSSTDGITWSGATSLGVATTIKNIEYHTENTWLIGISSSPYLYRSTDNGVSWSDVNTASSIGIHNSFTSNGNVIVATPTSASTSIYYSTDAGNSFNAVTISPASANIPIAIWDGTQFAVATATSALTLTVKTSTNGSEWTQQSSLPNATSVIRTMVLGNSGQYLIGPSSSIWYQTGPTSTSFISKNNLNTIPPNGRVEIYSYNQSQFVVSGDLGNPVSTNKGNTASRPGSPAIGDLYYNTELNYFESYTANGWFPIAAAPLAPTGVTATNQGSGRAYDNGQMSVAFTPNSSGGAPTSFILTPSPSTSPSTFTGSTSPIIVTGLASSTQYTYTVQSTSPYGTSAASAASAGVTATTVPQAPTIGTATGGDTEAFISFTANATGGSAITSYTVTSSPGNITASGASSPITVTGLTNDTAYTFTVTATNANGTSEASAASNSVTPVSGITVSYYVLGGGAAGAGGGSGGSGGGGGGGGSSYSSSYVVQYGTDYTVTIGAGGAYGGVYNGSSSSFESITSGGGLGSTGWAEPGLGGSGLTQNGGNGGLGYNSGNAQNGSSGYINPIDSIARGGGGGGSTKSGTQGLGVDGGGNGKNVSGKANWGFPNSGGGGGGNAMDNVGFGGNGGSGIVIVKYAGVPIASGGTVVTSGGFTTHTFTQSEKFSVQPYNVSLAKASGGLIYENSTHIWHVFNTSGTFTPSQTISNVEYLVVAGGGGSGYGGGGAGGYRSGTFGSMSAQAYNVTVGAGGAAGIPGEGYPRLPGGDGTNSSVHTISSTGGGGGGIGNDAPYSQYRAGRPGGSGGGGSASWTDSAGGGSGNAGNYSPSEGNNGGSAAHQYGFGGGGGGGGAAQAGQNLTAGSANGGNGGNGIQNSITGTAKYYAGGGGGLGPTGSTGTHGLGQGGGTGGGGQGSWQTNISVYGTGDSGIVVLKYAK